MIQVPHGEPFAVVDLINYMRNSGRNYIIQGQQICSFEKHTKRNSLDYWLRSRDQKNQNTKQADNSVLDALAATGLFKIIDKLPCPDSGRTCKGIVII